MKERKRGTDADDPEGFSGCRDVGGRAPSPGRIGVLVQAHYREGDAFAWIHGAMRPSVPVVR